MLYNLFNKINSNLNPENLFYYYRGTIIELPKNFQCNEPEKDAEVIFDSEGNIYKNTTTKFNEFIKNFILTKSNGDFYCDNTFEYLSLIEKINIICNNYIKYSQLKY